MTEYAIVIDDVYDAVLLRDVLHNAALTHAERAASATTTRAITRNREQSRIFRKYADRCEHIRKQEAERIAANLERNRHEPRPQDR